ncbi:formamidopyrimidine-DNA glycosylase [Paenibacillus stellifer]|uniref:Formamidopyrimidine-DNA glycosylase n=1 Tax=Paenibacillus stellifer TaxID=169760 RepID=A0A089LTR4_9BACL|nr:DNA-formamidopyrimidine glycosylase family protein [Paenibacillus stellifer]AIQ64307.1 formamidopyrimidine-DNA glycosylase [Paenibacillus stellifer]
MPEYPEMENYRRLLSQHIINLPITGVTVNRDKSLNVEPEVFKASLTGVRIVFVERRGKNLIFHLQDGKRLLLHLMLGGLLFYGTEEERPNRTTQIELHFGEQILYIMGLRLGYMHFLTVKQTEEALAKLGPDIMDRKLTEDKFALRLKGRRGSLKSVLVNQSVVAGIGNCYADEIAFEAGLLPSAPVQGMPDETVSRLYQAVRKTLSDAADIGGYMEMPFMTGDTVTGAYNDQCKVYDRGGETCVRCGGTIRKEEQSGRKVFYCPDCQHEH